MPDLTLEEKDRQKLDSIVSQMVSNKETDDAIQFVVSDFKTKYGKQQSVKPLPSVKEQSSFAIDPVGTYQPTQPKPFDMKSYLQGIPQDTPQPTTLNHAGVNVGVKVGKTHKPDVKEAIDKAVIDKNAQFGATQPDMNFGRDEITKKVKEGELVPDFDSEGNSVLKSKTGLFDSFVNAVNKASIERADNANLASLDNEGKIKYLEAKRVIDAKNDNTKAGGVGKFGEFLGENADVMAKTAVGAMTGGALAPELVGAGHFGGFLNTVKDFATGGYGNALQKTYSELRSQGMPEQQAMEQAHKAGLVGEATGITTGTVLAGMPKLKADNGVVEEFLSTMIKSSGKMGAVSGTEALANNIGEAAVGVHKNAKDVINDIGQSAAHGVALGAAFEVLLNIHKVPGAIREQAAKVVASIPEGVRNEFINNAVLTGDLPKGKADEIKSAVAVVRPEEMNRPHETTIAPKEEGHPERAFPAIILPENNSKPNIVELRSNSEGTTGDVVDPIPAEEVIPEGQTNKGEVQPIIDETGQRVTETSTPILNKSGNETIQENSQGDKPTDKPAAAEIRPNEVSLENQKAAGGGEEPPKVEIAVGDKGQDLVGVTHHAMDKLAEEFGLPDRYDKKDSSVEEWDTKATEKIKNGEMPALVKKLEAGGDINEVEQRMILQHVAGLKYEYEISKDEKVLDEFRRIKKLNDVVGNTWGKVGVARQGQIPPHPLEGGLASAIVAKEEANGVDKLTDTQRQAVESQVEAYKKAAADAEAKVAAAEAKNAELLAEKELAAVKKTTHRAKKTKEAFVTERKAIVDSIKDKWKNAGNDGTLTAVPVPYAKQLYAIAPDVAKLVRSLVEEGVDTLADVVSNVHATMKEVIPEVTERDVRDIVAGKYKEQKETKNQLQTKLNDIVSEQKLLDEYDRIVNNEPKTESAKIEKNRKLTELTKRIDTLKSEKSLEAELQRIRDRKEKEPSEIKRRELSDREKELTAQIQEESSVAGLEKELQRVRDRKAKEPSTQKKRDLSDREKKLVRLIQEEQGIANLEKELARVTDRRQKEPSDNKKRELSDKEKELADKIKEQKSKWSDEVADERKIRNVIKSNERAAAKLKERIANKDFEPEKPIPFSENMELKKKHPELYNEALNAMFKKEEAKHAFDIAQRKDELAKRSKSEKIIDFTKKLAGTTRAIAAGIDDSFALVQAGWTLMTNPKEGAYAFKEHVKDAVSEERFNREITRLHNSPVWPLIKSSGLDILSPQSLLGKEREDLFVNTFLDTDFKIGGKSFNVGKYTTLPFERAFTSLGNNLRLGLFNKQVEALYEGGKTFESHPQDFKDAARVINELTGRGKLHPKIEQVSDIITPFIWSPRMIASSMNLLGVSDAASLFIAKKGFYGKLSPSARNMALSQMAKGIGLATSLMAAAAFGGAQVDYDPESVTFGDIKFGNKSYNVFGRYASMMKLVVQVATGKRKSVTGGEEDLDKRGGHSRIGMVGSYLRGKMTPLSGTAFDAIQHEDYYKHTPVTPADAAMNITIPMSMKNLKKGLTQDGTLYLLNDFLPSFFGMTVKDARDFPMGATTGKYGGGGAVGEYLDKNDLNIPMARQNTLKVTSAKRPMTDDEFAKFKAEREKLVTKELTDLMDKGKWIGGVKVTLKDEKLTTKERQELISKATAMATEQAKENIFGKEQKTMKQKMTDRQDYIKNRMLYK